MSYITYNFCLHFFILFSSGEPTGFRSKLNHDERIVGGNTTVIELYPYHVSILLAGSYKCGGSIVSRHHIVTAAHCTLFNIDFLTVRAGSSFHDKGGSIHKVIKIMPHEKVNINYMSMVKYDVAVMKVDEPFEFDETRRPIQMFKAKEKSKPGSRAIATGWGMTSDGGSEADQLQVVNVPIVDHKLCNEAYKIIGGISEEQICAGYPGIGKRDTCVGDSGGPLTIGGRLAGIISFGIGCAKPEYPGVYTEVAKVRKWIMSKIKS